MDSMTTGLIEHLSGFVSKKRLDTFEKVLQYRTRYITVVCENIYQGHNASAVLRTCDCFGIQDIHVVESGNSFEVNTEVALGASKWLNLYRYGDTGGNPLKVFSALRERGYRIVAASPHQKGVTLDNFDLAQKPAAIVFGTEKEGLSPSALDNADEFVTIDMYGFTESFNVSVSAGIILHNLRQRLNTSNISWQLDKESMMSIKLNWLRQSVKRSDLIEKEFVIRHYPERNKSVKKG